MLSGQYASMTSAVRSVMGVVLLLGLAGVATAQETRTFTGRVIWVEANTMAFVPDGGGGAFDVDISKIDQTVTDFLKSGDRITVVGTVTPDGNRLIATSITPNPR